MIHRTIVAALLIGLASSSGAAAFNSQTYDKAKDLSAGKTAANLAYDGSLLKTAAPVTVPPAGSAAETVPTTPKPAGHKEAAVPKPSVSQDGEHHLPPIDVVESMVTGAGILGVAGFAAGFMLGGGPAGAAVGAFLGMAAGAGIAYLLSKKLRRA